LNNGSRYCILALIHILNQYFLPLKLDLVSPRPDTERIQLLARQKTKQQRLFGSHLCRAIFILLQSMTFGINLFIALAMLASDNSLWILSDEHSPFN